MKEASKTKAQLADELVSLRQEIDQLKASETRYQRLNDSLCKQRDEIQNYLDIADVIIIVIDKKENVSRINRNGCNILGYQENEVIGNNFFHTFIPKTLRQNLRTQFNRLLSGIIELMQVQQEIAILMKSGEEKITTWQLSAIMDENGAITGAVCSVVDITDRKRAEDALRSLLFVDELTGLYNRRGFLNMSKQQLNISNRTKSEMLLIFADIDGMKNINDTLGHHEGDLALIDTANILRETFRDSDIIARIGGDEFVVLAIGNYDSNADILTNRLKDNLSAHNEKANRSFKLSISMGIATYISKFPYSVDAFMAYADKLMYEQKREHRMENPL